MRKTVIVTAVGLTAYFFSPPALAHRFFGEWQLGARFVETPAFRSKKKEARWHHDRAVALATAGEIDDAVSEDRVAIAMDPDRPGYQILMGRLLIDEGKLQSALNQYQKVCDRWPELRSDLCELMSGLQMGLAFLKLDRQIMCAQSNTPVTAGELARLGDRRVENEDSDSSADGGIKRVRYRRHDLGYFGDPIY